MTIIIKSNEVSTRNMGSLFGLSKTDYSLLLDFNLGEYRTKSGGVIAKTTLADAISLSRASKATYIDSENNLKEAGINEPRIQYDKASGKKGLLIESGFTELLTNPYVPATQTVNYNTNSTARLVLVVKGTGSATLSGSRIEVDGGSSFTATEGKPASCIVNAFGGTPVTVTVSGNLEVFSMKNAFAVSGLAFPPQGLATVAPDNCALSAAMFSASIANRKSCTILMKIIENPKSSFSGGSSGYNLFTLRDTLNNKAGIYVFRTTGNTSFYNATFLLADTTVVKNVNKAVSDSLREHNYALTYDNYGADAILARNGEATVSDVAFDLRANKLLLGSQNGWNSPGNLNGIITALVVYPYKMTYEEMERLTASSL